MYQSKWDQFFPEVLITIPSSFKFIKWKMLNGCMWPDCVVICECVFYQFLRILKSFDIIDPYVIRLERVLEWFNIPIIFRPMLLYVFWLYSPIISWIPIRYIADCCLFSVLNPLNCFFECHEDSILLGPHGIDYHAGSGIIVSLPPWWMCLLFTSGKSSWIQ